MLSGVLRLLIKAWLYVTEQRIYEYSGNRSELNKIRDCELMQVDGRSIAIVCYEKTRVDHIVRFGVVRAITKTTYVIEAVFVGEFQKELLDQHEVKYYMDFNMVGWFNKDMLLHELSGNFVTYLRYKFNNLTLRSGDV